jgi:MATE family multidrug resistance protein
MIGSEAFAFLARSIMVGRFGPSQRLAQSVVTQYYISMVGLALALKSSNVITIGNAYGDNDIHLIQKRAKIGIGSSLILGVIFLLILLIFKQALAGLFIKDNTPNINEVMSITNKFFTYTGSFLLFDTLNMGMMGALAGKGSTKLPTLITTIGVFVGANSNPKCDKILYIDLKTIH